MSEDGNNNQKSGDTNQQELASRTVQIQSKRFYLDVKENKRGRFIKFAEVGVGGRKSRIIMSMGAANDFKTHLIEFSDYHSSLGPSHGDTVKGEEDGLLKSQTLVRDRKRYYLDLKENQRGRFLRVSMVMSRGPRAQIAIPAQGLIEFKDQLGELLDQYGLPEEQSAVVPLPESKSLRADNKSFYFDCGSNARGIFLRVSEVRSNFRSAITVPENLWGEFVSNMKEVIEKIECEKVNKPNATNNAVEVEQQSELPAATAN